MIISLIGMTGSGKSYWAKKFEEKGFRRFSIDDLLEEKLSTGLRQLGYEGLADLAQWMRQPYDDRHQSTSATYLAYEKKAMEEVLNYLQTKKDENVVVDTTGSVIYLGDALLQRLSALTRVVYLETPQSVQQEMYEVYLSNPKPVIWGDSFSIKKGETPREALARCYPQLLVFRTKQYKKFAYATVDYYTLREPQFTVEKFLQQIQK